MTMVKNAPRKVTNAMDISFVGQKMSDAGTHASGGIGRRISKTGKKNSRKYRLTASASPSGMPMSCAKPKPASTRLKLRYQLSQYPGCGSTDIQASATSVGGGIRPMNGSVNPNHWPQRDPISHRISAATIARMPRHSLRFSFSRWRRVRRPTARALPAVSDTAAIASSVDRRARRPGTQASSRSPASNAFNASSWTASFASSTSTRNASDESRW